MYVATSLGLAVLMAGQTYNRLWSNLDFWVWLGAVREFAQRPLGPHHPLVAVDAPDAYLSPYTWVLGVVTRWSGADPVDVLATAGMFNLVVVLGGVWFFTRMASDEPWVPPLALAFTLVAWGYGPWRWSGYPNLNSLGSVLPLGSTLAYGTGLIALALLWRWTLRWRWPDLLGVTFLVPLTLLVHQMTAMWVVLIGMAIVVSSLPSMALPDATRLVAAGTFAAGLALLWPFYSVWDLLFGVGGFDAVNLPTYNGVLVRSFLALPGLLLLAIRLRRNPRDVLGIAGLLIALCYAIGWVVGQGALGRLFPGLMLVAHVTMADWCAAQLRQKSPNRRLVGAGLVGILAVGVVGTATGWVRSVPRDFVGDDLADRLRIRSYIEPGLSLREYFGGDEVVVADRAGLLVGGSAAKVVSVGVPQPFIDDHGQRVLDTTTILDPRTPAMTRSSLLRKYDVTHLVVEEADAPELLALIPDAEMVAITADYAVISLNAG